jgi:hypothetical protein
VAPCHATSIINEVSRNGRGCAAQRSAAKNRLLGKMFLRPALGQCGFLEQMLRAAVQIAQRKRIYEGSDWRFRLCSLAIQLSRRIGRPGQSLTDFL